MFPAAVMNVDLQCVKNNTEHHTKKSRRSVWSFRRGQAFSLILSAERLDHSDIQITAGDGWQKHLFDQKYSEKCEILLEFNTEFSVWICENVIYFCDQSCIKCSITAVFSVTWSSEIIICWFCCISDYYWCWKQLCCPIK